MWRSNIYRFLFILILLGQLWIIIDNHNVNAHSEEDDIYMVISIVPAGTFELKNPLGKRIIHHYSDEKKDVKEIPDSFYEEVSYSEDEPYSNHIYINCPVEGKYVLAIYHISDDSYLLSALVRDGKTKEVFEENISFTKGETHVYEIIYDKAAHKVTLIRIGDS
jgi:hypothetical protein